MQTDNGKTPRSGFQGVDKAEQNDNKNSTENIEQFIHNQKAMITITKTKSDTSIVAC